MSQYFYYFGKGIYDYPSIATNYGYKLFQFLTPIMTFKTVINNYNECTNCIHECKCHEKIMEFQEFQDYLTDVSNYFHKMQHNQDQNFNNHNINHNQAKSHIEIIEFSDCTDIVLYDPEIARIQNQKDHTIYDSCASQSEIYNSSTTNSSVISSSSVFFNKNHHKNINLCNDTNQQKINTTKLYNNDYFSLSLQLPTMTDIFCRTGILVVYDIPLYTMKSFYSSPIFTLVALYGLLPSEIWMIIFPKLFYILPRLLAL
jgi:hypothetical protein